MTLTINEITSEQQLDKLFNSHQCNFYIDPSCYRKTRYIEDKTYDDLIKYRLNFEPYIQIAKVCSMLNIHIYRSRFTNRFYIGFFNTGGHAPRFEIRPLRLEDIKNYSYIQDMFSNHAQKLSWGIDINENYDI